MTGIRPPLWCAALLVTGSVAGFLGALTAATPVQAAVFLGVGIVGGALLRGSATALPWGRLAFALQVPIVATAPITYHAFSGVGLELELSAGAVAANVHLGGGFELTLGDEPRATAFGVNLVALLCLLRLLVLRGNPEVSPLQAVVRSVRVDGRTGRSEWWLSLACTVIVPAGIVTVFGTLEQATRSGLDLDGLLVAGGYLDPETGNPMIGVTLQNLPLTTWLTFAAVCLCGWLLVAASVRRLCDLGRSAWFLVLALLPVVGLPVLMLWLGLFPGKPREAPGGERDDATAGMSTRQSPRE